MPIYHFSTLHEKIEGAEQRNQQQLSFASLEKFPAAQVTDIQQEAIIPSP